MMVTAVPVVEASLASRPSNLKYMFPSWAFECTYTAQLLSLAWMRFQSYTER